jgi:hypothetical protein
LWFLWGGMFEPCESLLNVSRHQEVHLVVSRTPS